VVTGTLSSTEVPAYRHAANAPRAGRAWNAGQHERTGFHRARTGHVKEEKSK